MIAENIDQRDLIRIWGGSDGQGKAKGYKSDREWDCVRGEQGAERI